MSDLPVEPSQSTIVGGEAQSAADRMILDHMPGYAALLDVEGRVLALNGAAAEAAGEPREALVGRPFWSCNWFSHDPGTAERMRGAVVDATCGGADAELVRRDVSCLHARRGQVHIHFTFKAVRGGGDAGRVTHLCISGMDVTERRLAETQLRDSERLLRLAAEAASFGSYHHDASRNRTTWSAEFFRIHGVKPDTPRAGDWVLERIHPDDRERFAAHMANALAHPDEDYFGEFRIVRPDGEVRAVIDRGRVTREADGRLIACGMAIDVTEQKALGARLGHAEQHLQRAAEAAQFGTYDADFVTGRLTWSDELFRLLRLPVTGEPPVAPGELPETIHPDDRERVRRAIDDTLKPGGDPHLDLEHRVVDPADPDTPHWVRLVGDTQIIEGPGGPRAVRASGAVIDITAAKRHEHQMQTVMAELNHRVKNTLAVVQAVLSKTLRGASDLQSFTSVFEQRLRAMASVHAMLTESEWRGLGLRELVMGELSPRIGADDQLEVNGPDVQLPPNAAMAMHMILHELATNAAKYGGLRGGEQSGGGRVSIGWTADTTVHDGALVFHWREHVDGGISPVRASGYGTRLMAELAAYELHGRLDSNFHPDGLECRLVCPLSFSGTGEPLLLDPPAPAPAPSDGADDPREGENLVLLVEDSHVLASLLASELEAAGFAVLGPAPTLALAEQLIEARLPAAAVLDVNLNGEKVYPLARRLRDADVPFALLTGYNRADLPDDLRNAAVLPKPVLFEDVEGFLSSHVRVASDASPAR